MASKKKIGLSIEEKVVKVEEFLSERPEPFTFKELELALPKVKGVVSQSVQECLDVLVSERRAASDKVGALLLYWRFAAAEAKTLRATALEATADAARIAAENDTRRAALAALRASAPDAAEAAALQLRLASARREAAALRAALADSGDIDPAFVAAIDRSTALAVASANLWTDNIFLMEEAAGRRMGVPRGEFRSRFQIPLDFDFIGMGDDEFSPPPVVRR